MALVLLKTARQAGGDEAERNAAFHRPLILNEATDQVY
jgi:hypothetical protein